MPDVDYGYELDGLYRYKLVRTGAGDHMQGQFVRDKLAEENAEIGQILRDWLAESCEAFLAIMKRGEDA